VEHPTAVARALRTNDPPVISRIESDEIVLDPRTVDTEDDGHVVSALTGAIYYTNSVDPGNRPDV
jgi:seryl-tRNA(Sec) selenium transferase